MSKLVPKGSDQKTLPDLSYKTAIFMAFNHQDKEWLTPEDVVNYLSTAVKMPDGSSWKSQIAPMLKSLKQDGSLQAGEANNSYKVKDQSTLRRELERHEDIIQQWLKAPNETGGQPTPPTDTPPGGQMTAATSDMIFETKPVISDIIRNGSVRNDEASGDPPVNLDVDPSVWTGLFRSNTQDSGDVIFDPWGDPTKPRVSNYILFGIVLHLNRNKWMSFDDIIRVIRDLFPFYGRMPEDQLTIWKKFCKRNMNVKVKNAPDYFEQTEDETNPKYRTGTAFAADMKKWLEKHPVRNTRQWMSDPESFSQIVGEIIGNLSSDHMNLSASSTLGNTTLDSASSFLSNDDEDAQEAADDGAETKPILPHAYLFGIIISLYGYGDFMTVEEIFARIEELFPYYRNKSDHEKAMVRRRLSSSLTHLSKNQTSMGRFVERKEGEWKGSFRIIRRYFLDDFEPWLRKNRNRRWDKWTDNPGHIFKVLNDLFEKDLKLFDTPASPQRAAAAPGNGPQSRLRAVTSKEPKMPVAIIMGMATLNSTEKRLFSRDLKRAIIEVLPFYETNELALSNILKKVLFSMGKKFGQVTTTAPDSNRQIGKFYVKKEDEMREMAETYLREHPNIQAVEYGFRNGDELQKMISGEWKPYESNLDPNLRVAKAKEVVGRTPTTRRSAKEALLPAPQSAPVRMNPPLIPTTSVSVPTPALALAPAPAPAHTATSNSDSEFEVEEEEEQERGDEEEEIRPGDGRTTYPFQMTFDWRSMITSESPTFETVFPHLIQNKVFPIATSPEEYLRLENLYRTHDALVREMGAPAPDWENGFGENSLLALNRRRDVEGRERRRGRYRSRSRHYSRERSYSRDRSRDRYRRSRDSYRRRSRSRDDSRDRRRQRSRSRDDYRRRRSRDYDRQRSYSPRHRHPEVMHCGPDVVISNGQLYQKVASQPMPPPMPPTMYPMPYPYAYMPPPHHPYMAPQYMPPPVQQPQMMYHQQPAKPCQMPSAPMEPPRMGTQSTRRSTTRYKPIKREIEIVEINDDEMTHRQAITANNEPIQYYDERMHVDHEVIVQHEETVTAPISF